MESCLVRNADNGMLLSQRWMRITVVGLVCEELCSWMVRSTSGTGNLLYEVLGWSKFLVGVGFCRCTGRPRRGSGW